MTTDPNNFDENESAGLMGRRALLGKVAAGGALVWASPLITSTAHAQTGGTCIEGGSLLWTVTPWSGWASGTGQIVQGQVQDTGVIATLTTTLVGTAPVTGDHTVNQGYLRLAQSTSASATTYAAAHRTIQIDFSTPVTNIAFDIQNVDRDTNNNSTPNWDDRVSVSSNGAAPVLTLGGLTGTNDTTTGIFRNANTQLTFPDESNGIVTVSITGSITSITINFWNGDRVQDDGTQNIYLSPIEFGDCA